MLADITQEGSLFSGLPKYLHRFSETFRPSPRSAKEIERLRKEVLDLRRNPRQPVGNTQWFWPGWKCGVDNGA